MKNFIYTFCLFFSFSLTAQYCAFYDFEAKEPEMVVQTLKSIMKTEWAQNIKGSKSLFEYAFNGTNGATHSVQFCFQDEAGLQDFMTSFANSPVMLLLSQKLDQYINPISSTLNTPAWYQNDWSNDQVFMIWQMQVSEPGQYAAAFIPFAKKMMSKMNVSNSFGLGYPIVGKSEQFSHFVWAGAPDIKTALQRTKTMYSDPAFIKFNEKVAGIRTLVNTTLMMRVMDF